MILECPQCQSQFKLEPEQLGASGRTVRCTDCRHTWFQPPARAAVSDAEKDQEIFDDILSRVNGKAAAAPVSTAVPDLAPEPVMTAIAEDRTLVARHESPPVAVITHNPLGVGAAAFGGLTFCLCLSLTLAIVFLGKKQIVRHWPQAVLLYKTIGFPVHPPGEGLRFSEIVAERRIDKEKKTLVVEGKMTNMTERAIVPPPLHVLLKDDRQAVIKEWKLKSGPDALASGETAPLTIQLSDAPEDGAAVEVHAREE